MSKRKRRYVRTIILGVLAMGALVWAAVDTFGVPLEQLWLLFVQTLAVLASLMLAAAIAAALWTLLRRLSGRD